MPLIQAESAQVAGDLIGKSFFKKVGRGISKAGKGVVKAATSKTGIGILSFAAGAGTGFVATKYGPGMLTAAKKKLSALTSSGSDDDNEEVRTLKEQIAALQAQQSQQGQQPAQAQVQQSAQVQNGPAAPLMIKSSGPKLQMASYSTDEEDDGGDAGDDYSDVVDVVRDAKSQATTKMNKTGLSPILILGALGLGAFVMFRK